MRNPAENLRLLFLSALLSVSPLAAAGHDKTALPAVLDARIQRFELTEQTLADGIAKLSLEPIPLAVGFEEVLRERFVDAPVRAPRFSLLLKGKTVREVLDTLCSMDSRYVWAWEGGTVNVFPRATIDDPSYLLNRKIDKFDLHGITDIEQGLLAIVQQLPPPKEQVGIAQVGGGLPYPPQPWRATFENVTVRQIINRLASHSGGRSAWVFSGSKDFRAFSFFQAGFYPSVRR